MKPAEFWRIIEETVHRHSTNDDLRRALKKLSAEEVVAFEALLRGYLERAFCWDLWGAAILHNSDGTLDGFVRVLRSIVGCGRKPYERALKNADSLVGHAFGEGNEFLGPTLGEVYTAKTGKAPPAWRLRTPAGKRWSVRDRRELAKRLPRIHALAVSYEFGSHFAEARACAQRNELRRANELFRKALATLEGAPNPGIPVAHGNMMVNAAQMGSLAEARKQLALAIETTKHLPLPAFRESRAELDNQIAWFYCEHGPDSSLREALTLARRAQKSMHDPLEAMETEMQILLRLGREANARAIAVKALAKNRRHPSFRDAKKRWKL